MFPGQYLKRTPSWKRRSLRTQPESSFTGFASGVSVESPNTCCWVTAVVFSTFNAALLTVRIRAENAALRSLPDAAPEASLSRPG